jgi:putative colanic acid biosynthesis UDP-glucose lipid carrier transferase
MIKPSQNSASILFFTDFIAVVLASLIFYWFRFDSWNLSAAYLNLTTLGAILILLISTQMSIYKSWRGHYGFQLLSKLIATWFLAGAILVTYILFSHQGAYFSRLWLGQWWLGSFLFASIIRFCIYIYLGFQRSSGKNTKNILIIGTKNSAENIKEKLAKNPWAGYAVKKTLSLDESLTPNHIDITNHLENIEEIWIATTLENANQLNCLYYNLRNCMQNIRYIPDVSNLRLINNKISEIAGLQTIDLSTSPLDGFNAIVKRLEDIILGTIIFIIALPVMIVVAIAIKLTSQGPILFKQKRHGIDGKPIKVYKFRSMYVHNEDDKTVTQAKKNDSRITPLGAFLRRTSLDELPQFYNVLQGRMSIVGPRPHAIEHNKYYSELVESYMVRHKVKPGITGWAQANGYRGETDTIDKMQKRVEHDLYYIDNWTLWFDIKIIIITIISVLTQKNAY